MQEGAEQLLTFPDTFGGDRFVPPVGACSGPSSVTPLCHLERSVTVAIVINSSGFTRTADTNRKCFLFTLCKHSYRKSSHLGQEAEVTEDRDRTASRVLHASDSSLDPLLLQRLVTFLIF